MAKRFKSGFTVYVLMKFWADPTGNSHQYRRWIYLDGSDRHHECTHLMSQAHAWRTFGGASRFLRARELDKVGYEVCKAMSYETAGVS